MEIQKPKKEQDRTMAKKQLFLAVFSMTLGVVTTTCERAKIHRDTYYDWRKKDPEFAAAVKSACTESIRYFVNRKDNGF